MELLICQNKNILRNAKKLACDQTLRSHKLKICSKTFIWIEQYAAKSKLFITLSVWLCKGFWGESHLNHIRFTKRRKILVLSSRILKEFTAMLIKFIRVPCRSELQNKRLSRLHVASANGRVLLFTKDVFKDIEEHREVILLSNHNFKSYAKQQFAVSQFPTRHFCFF